jgi:hypothetical protein
MQEKLMAMDISTGCSPSGFIWLMKTGKKV